MTRHDMTEEFDNSRATSPFAKLLWPLSYSMLEFEKDLPEVHRIMSTIPQINNSFIEKLD